MISDYIRTSSVSEVVDALVEYQPWGRILAGGTDILPKTRGVRQKKSIPLVFIDVNRISDFRTIKMENGWLVIGPAVTIRDLIYSNLIKEEAPVLAQAAALIGSTEIRNRGTVGGNIGSKNASADLLIPLIGLKAIVEICDTAGRREMNLEEILRKSVKDLGRRLVITAIKIPTGQAAYFGYKRWSRESMGRSYLSVMVIISPEIKAGSYRLKAIVGGGGLWPRSVEAVMPVQQLSATKSLTLLVKLLVEKGEKTNRRNMGDYRRQIMEVLLREALYTACEGGRF
ncbi:6-hydroxypseudooxynicotine dehydrogenase complex subunit alpha [Pelotomaculum schinkii]|uniref:6-hydroxypseudooxynicotine dehydrogenase complex subunit alpha n=1 Tax=Pelotomaculum schinkii TaxID=78350 RepID=A0A4Y7R665_9FIRM|nr:FAD binding domain-containing protein [Pelotomaculum schinkii]TEB04454.1 6-hydroxypseudooxynicotine dehydrogenase complex subunit alpha [Pelotomaculum schinkii]